MIQGVPIMRPERSGYVIAHSAVTEDVTLKAFTAPMLPELPPCDGWFACGVDYFYPIGPAKLPGGVKAVALYERCDCAFL
jgi:hypothetical protein